MSTATKNSQYVEFDEFIEFQLQKTRQGIKVTDLVTALCGVSVAVLAYLLVFAVCDHWLIPGGFGYFWRVALLGVLLVGSLSWVGFKVVLPGMRRINRLYAARAIEEVSPELDSNLINWVDLRTSGREVSPLILRSIEKRAAVSLSHADVDEAVDRQALLKLLYALLAVVALFAAYVVFSPKKVGPSIWRALLPTSDVRVATRTQIEKVDPPGAEVPAGSFLEVTADLLGDAPSQVVLKYTTADRRVVDRAIEMRQVEEGLKRYRCVLDGERGEGLMQDFDFWVEAGDAHSASFHVTVIQPPSASVTDLVYDFPKYTQKERETQPNGSVDTLEGTTVTFNATTNMPVKSALLQFSDDEKFASKGEEKALRVIDGTKLTTDWKAEFRNDGTFPKYYRIQVKTDRGLTDPNPAIQTILLRRDVAPEIELVAPKLNMSLFANAIVPVVVKARDPDFLLRDVQLFAIKDEKQIFDKVIDEKRVSETEVRFDWKLADLNLKAGDTITMYVAARDNKEPFSNRKESQRRVIDIIEPGSAKQVEEQLAKDKQKIDELQQTDKPNNGQRDENDPGVESPDQDNKPSNDPRDNEKPNEDKKPREDQPNKDRKPQDPKDNDSANDSEKTSPSKNGSKKEGSDSQDNKDDSSNNDKQTESDPKSKKTSNQNQQTSETSDSKDGQSKEQQPLKNNGADDADALRKALERQQQRDRQSKPSESKSNEKDSNEKKKDGSNDGADEKSTEQPNGSSDKDKKEPAVGDQPMPDKGTNNADSKKNEKPDGKPMPMPGSDQEKPAEKTAEKNPDSQTPPKSDGQNGDEKSESKSPMKSEKKPNSESKTNDSKGKDDSTDKTDSKSKDPGASSNQPDGNKPQPGQKESKSKDGTDSKDNKSSDPKSNDSNPKKTESNDPPKKDDANGKKTQSKPSDKPEDKERSQDGDSNKPANDQKPGNPKSADKGDDSQGKTTKSKDDKTGSDSTPSKDGDEKQKVPGMKDADGMPTDDKSDDKDGAGKKTDDPKNAKKSDSKDADSKDTMGSEKEEKESTEGDPKKAKPDAKSKDSKKDGKPEVKDKENGNDSPKSGEKKSDLPGAKDGKSNSKQAGEDSGDSDAKDGDGTGKAKDGGNANKGKPGKLQSREGSEDGSKGDGASSGDADSAPEPVNLEDKKKATNLVLKKLKEELERGEVDQDFLKDLGWTENDLKRFVDRLDQQSKAGNDTPAEQARRRQFEEMLKSLDLRSGGGTKQDTIKAKRSTNDFGDKQVPVPLEYRDAYKKYADKLSKQKKGDAK